jgi:DNA-binding MarR family transcriptional regulator
MADPKARTASDIYGRPGFKLRRAHQISQSIFMAECGALALTPTQYGVLVMLSLHPGLDQISLARLLGLDRSTTGMVVAALGKRGLVFRLVDPGDRRKRAMRITPAGERLLEKVQPGLARSRERLLAPLTASERQMLLALLDKLLAASNAEVRVPLVPCAASG